jgi:hypothetical protein
VSVLMLPSPMIRTRLLRDEDREETSEPTMEGSAANDPCMYVACIDGLALMGVDVRRTKVRFITHRMAHRSARPLAHFVILLLSCLYIFIIFESSSKGEHCVLSDF